MVRIKRITTINSIVALLLLVAFALMALQRFHSAAVENTREDLNKSMRTFRELLRQKGTGFRVADGKLWAGDYLLNGNFEPADKVQEIFGGTATIFQGDLRVATNVLSADGTRAVGTRLEGPAFEAIFKKGESFRGETLILGIPYLTAYDPIRDGSGNILGALYVGVKKSVFLAHYQELQSRLLLILLGFLTVFLAFAVLFHRLTKEAERDRVDDLKFLQKLIDTIPNPVFYQDSLGRFLGGNQAFAEFIGLPTTLIIGKSYGDLALGAQAEGRYETDQELFRGGGAKMHEAALVDAAGVRHEVLFYQADFPATSGSPAGTIGTMLDITERKKVETELEASRQYLSDIIEFYPDAVMVIDRDRKVVTWNRAMEEVSGVPAHEMLGKGNYEYARPFHGERRPILIDLAMQHDHGVQGHYASVGQYGDTLVGEAYVHNARGEVMYFYGTAAALRDSKGEVVGAIESIRNVTERKRAEEELELKNLILTTQQECSIDGILVVDESQLIISYNSRFVNMWGIPVTRGGLKDYAPVVQLLAAQSVDPEGFLSRVQQLYADREAKSQEEIVLKDGRIFDRYSAPMTGTNGKYFGRVWYFHDVTDLQRAKEAQMRTQKLESLGVLAGGIAHDFNNILTAILGNISLARFLDGDREKADRNLEAAEQAAIRATDLTRQLLTFARGGKPIKKVFQIAAVLKEAAGFALLGCAVKCEFFIEEGLWPVQADEGQLSQVIHNLVLNAVQATPAGGSITVRASNAHGVPEGTRMLKISVSDTGSGIPKDIQQKIFDPYFTTKKQGSGLGLATSYAIIKKHNGSLEVVSTPGEGSSFHICLPAALQLVTSPTGARPQVVRGKGRVLVMDDEEIVRQISLASLAELGYQAECAENGSAAVELYARRKQEGTPFLAVIMDLTVAGGAGGQEAIEQIIQIDPRVKAIVSSGYAADPVMIRYREYGFSAALTKPYRLDELSRAMLRLRDC